jgi:biotin carboxylase
MVDKRHYVPSPLDDWQKGHLSPENTPREEAYIRALLDVCETEQIDTLFPSYDPHVYVCAKNKTRFEDRGVLVVAPDYESVVTPLDKYRMVLAAHEAGFPHPKTYLATEDADLVEIADDLGFPIMVRPRATSGDRQDEGRRSRLRSTDVAGIHSG